MRLSHAVAPSSVLLCVLFAAMLACGGPVHLRPDAVAERSTRLELRSIEGLGGRPSWLDQGDSVRHVVHDAVEWTRLWNSRQSGNWPQLPPPPVDFDREVLLVAGWGSKPTNGYTITIDSALHQGAVIEIHVSRVQSCEVGMVVTWPMAIAKIPRPRGRIVYVDQPPRWSCGSWPPGDR